MLVAALQRDAAPRAPASLALILALAILVAAALGAALIVGRSWTLSLSEAGTILSAILVVAIAASLSRAGRAEPAFRAFCMALFIAGVASSLIGLVQVFAPTWPDGNWVAPSSLVARATGNLRQPNHLSSLLLWSIVATLWLSEAEVLHGKFTAVLVVVFIYVMVLSGSRTGALGTLSLAGWGLLDRRLSRRSRWLLGLAPVIYGTMWLIMSEWASHSHHLFGAQARYDTDVGGISSSRFAIWSNALALVKTHPWFGVGFGEFNFAWTLTPFPQRPLEFFDHTHDIVVNFLVELGIPLALAVLGLMLFAMAKALQNAIADGRDPAPEGTPRFPIQRAAFVIVLMVAVHSLLEYPLWYSYFLLPAAFAFGLCLERPDPATLARVQASQPSATRPLLIAAMFLVLGGTLALYDYMRVVVIFMPTAAEPLEQRIADGQKSVLFGHHADYAEATIAEHPGKVIDAFRRSTHYLLDARLMMAWANALNEIGETDKARYLAQRLKEFHNEQAAEFFAPCAPGATAAAAPASQAASQPGATPARSLPFQCLAPTKDLRFEDFR